MRSLRSSIRLFGIAALLISVCLLPLTASGADHSLTTTFVNKYNGLSGNLFMVTVLSDTDIVITAFDLNAAAFDSSNPLQAAVYYREGTYVDNFIMKPSAWTLVLRAPFTSAGINKPSYFPIPDLTLTAGKTYSIYIALEIFPTKARMYYTDGGGSFEDDNIRITTGEATKYTQFSTYSGPETWNGTIYYQTQGNPASSAAAAQPPQTGDALGNRLWLYGLAAVTAGSAVLLLLHRRFAPRRLT